MTVPFERELKGSIEPGIAVLLSGTILASALLSLVSEKRILVAEDNPLHAMWLEEVLFKAGYPVLGPSSTAARALELANLQAPAVAFICLKLCGISEGARLARHLRDRYRGVTFFTKLSPEEAASYRSSAAGFIVKPYCRDAIIAAIDLAYRIRRGERVCLEAFGVELFHQSGSVIGLSPDHRSTGRGRD